MLLKTTLNDGDKHRV